MRAGGIRGLNRAGWIGVAQSLAWSSVPSLSEDTKPISELVSGTVFVLGGTSALGSCTPGLGEMDRSIRFIELKAKEKSAGN